MSILSGKEPDGKRDLEEMYERLFPKIGRDFVYKEDLFKLLELIMMIVDPLGINPIDPTSDIQAKKKALQYKITLETGADGTKLYRDLINLDD